MAQKLPPTHDVSEEAPDNVQRNNVVSNDVYTKITTLPTKLNCKLALKLTGIGSLGLNEQQKNHG